MNKIRKYRKLAGLNQKELANKVGVHLAVISDWETERTKPKNSNISALCKALGTDFYSLFPGQKIRKATHSGKMVINEVELECAVLEDGTRVLSQAAVFKAFGRKRRGVRSKNEAGTKMPSFMDAKNLIPFVGADLIPRTKPIEYINEKNQISEGYDATILTDVCEVYLKAREKNVLTPKQLPLASVSEIIMRSFAKLGIIALIDEATGYQKERERNALQTILEKFIAKELQPWLKTFPDEYYDQMFRLKGWEQPIGSGRPGIVGHYTNDLIYKRLAPGVLDELQRVNPKTESGGRSAKHHQLLTPEMGHPKLREHIASVVTLMKVSDSWESFTGMVNKALPVYENRQLEIDFPNS